MLIILLLLYFFQVFLLLTKYNLKTNRIFIYASQTSKKENNASNRRFIEIDLRYIKPLNEHPKKLSLATSYVCLDTHGIILICTTIKVNKKIVFPRYELLRGTDTENNNIWKKGYGNKRTFKKIK